MGKPVIIRPAPAGVGSTITRISTPSRVPSMAILPLLCTRRTEARSFATDSMSAMTSSSVQWRGNSLFPGKPRPGPWPPPVASPARICLRAVASQVWRSRSRADALPGVCSPLFALWLWSLWDVKISSSRTSSRYSRYSWPNAMALSKGEGMRVLTQENITQ